MNKKNDVAVVDKDYLEDKIYIIRGQKVMLDCDLAKIYGYSTKAFNRQVKNNITKFNQEDFMFRLNKEEIGYLVRCKKYTSPNNSIFMGQNGGTRYLPFAFTESGVYMLMTVLKGPLATKQSIALIRLFRSMKDYIVENKDLITNKELELRTTILENNVKDISANLDNVNNSLNKVMNNFTDFESYKHFLILDGKKLEADIAYIKIFRLAKKSIYYIDNYIGIKTLELLSNARKGVSITIFGNRLNELSSLKEYMIKDFMEQNKNNSLEIKNTDRLYHDRFIIIDFNTENEKIFLCGSSCKDAGKKISTITKIEDIDIYKERISKLTKMSSLCIC